MKWKCRVHSGMPQNCGIKKLSHWKLFENRSETEMPQDCGIENWKLEIENS